MATLNKIDSNVTGLRYAEEASFGVLPTAPAAVWRPLEPNSYPEFGGSITTIARRPINDSRQRKKGVVTDLDATGGFDTDLTLTNLEDLLQGLMFASKRVKAETQRSGITYATEYIPVSDAETSGDTFTIDNLACVSVDSVDTAGSGYAEGDTITLTGGTGTIDTILTVTSVSGGGVTGAEILRPGRYSVAPTDSVGQGSTSGGGSGADFSLTYDAVVTFVDESLLFASGFTEDSNNGLHHLTSVPDDVTLTVSTNLADETPASTAEITTVGVVGGSGDLEIDASGSLPQLTSSSLDFDTLGLTPGEWVFIGGDTAGTLFSTAANNGFKRIRSIDTNAITFDKSESTMVTEVGGSLTVYVFFGRVLKNELGSSIVRRTYNLERVLGAPDDALPSQVQSEYIEGSLFNEWSVNIPVADKVTCTCTFLGKNAEQRTGATGVKGGSRPSIEETDAINTSSDFSQIKMAQVVAGDEAPDALFAYVTDLTLTVSNSGSLAKAVSVLGAFEIVAGLFAVSGSLTAYFSDVAAVSAVRNNADITLHAHMVKSNGGISIDLPLITLGDGRPNVAIDEPITLPLSMEAATGAKVHANLDYTALINFWPYLPSLADA